MRQYDEQKQVYIVTLASGLSEFLLEVDSCQKENGPYPQHRTVKKGRKQEEI